MVLLIVTKLFQSSRRRRLLMRVGKISTWNEIQIYPHRIAKMVHANFGYGKELWAIVGNTNDVDLELRSFKAGLLIFPRPHTSDVKKFCEMHQIVMADTMVKRSCR